MNFGTMVAKKHFPHLLTALYFICGIIVIFMFPGTGDSGDSIMHYLFARHAPAHPELFFDLWAKPVAVLLSSPFAQFGFPGMKLFNLLAGSCAAFLAYKTAEAMGMANAWLAVLFVVCSPLFFMSNFTGLTEPLFAVVMMAGLLAVVRGNYKTGAVVIAFLPFVRQEGLIILGIATLYLAFRKEWRAIPWLLSGYVFFSITGLIIHRNPFWVFTAMPYLSVDSIYGSGPLFHFVNKLYYVIGLPVYALMVLGLITWCWTWLRVPRIAWPDHSQLITGAFLAFFLFHTLAWFLGLFNSLGLNRVFVGVVPLIAIMALQGYNSAESFARRSSKYFLVIPYFLVGYTLVFPFTGTPASINWKVDMQLRPDQLLADEVADVISKDDFPRGKYYYSYPYMSLALGIDHFDQSRRSNLKDLNPGRLERGDMVVWDSHYGPEDQVSSEQLDQVPGLLKIRELPPENGRVPKIILYKFFPEPTGKEQP
jgi:hypothetical protein